MRRCGVSEVQKFGMVVAFWEIVFFLWGETPCMASLLWVLVGLCPIRGDGPRRSAVKEGCLYPEGGSQLFRFLFGETPCMASLLWVLVGLCPIGEGTEGRLYCGGGSEGG